MLVALRMLAEVVSECLGSMAGKRLDGVADDRHLACGDGSVSTHPGIELPVRRIELGPRSPGLLERLGLIGGRQTRDTRELSGSFGQRERLRAGDIIAGPIMPVCGQDNGGHIRQIITRDPGDGAITGRSPNDALTGEPTGSLIQVEAWAQEGI